MRKFTCNGATTQARDITEAAGHFAQLAAFDHYGEDGLSPLRFMCRVAGDETSARYAAPIGVMEFTGSTRGPWINLDVQEVA